MAATITVLIKVGGPVILADHSKGGTVITVVGNHDNVGVLAYQDVAGQFDNLIKAMYV